MEQAHFLPLSATKILPQVAIGALYALKAYPQVVKKVAIVDVDVHHGNGTEEIIKNHHSPDDLFFYSTHLYDKDANYEFYPGSGCFDCL